MTEFTGEEIANWHKRQPKKTIGAKALLLNEANEILLLKPTYKTTWHLPGGVVDMGEEPRDALTREVQEELATSLNPAKLHIVGTTFQAVYDALILLYSYDIRLQEQAAAFQLRDDEHEACGWFPPAEAITMIDDHFTSFWREYFHL